ncbi:uncharacterized protein MONBRDRAFT_28400 [Monosiga brevicollis MX1]|uniref:Uncharacterized protein n=1 Tax=Monosiga brevicollis TaxID=81824 RepID=A9V825_MONBE|nr:uncharacterized protein MONBRDRAFT_28400 [Monosiga brevicollis MX1]EDQ86195.1 predicted protein [Monosiga brevicollis MX1]|eukprot:XP_001748865.1 hypothetical protein [Monosiga brevicollis MX1]
MAHPSQRTPLSPSPWNRPANDEYKTPSRRHQPSMKSLLTFDALPDEAPTPRSARLQHRPKDTLAGLTADPAPVGAATPRFDEERRAMRAVQTQRQALDVGALQQLKATYENQIKGLTLKVDGLENRNAQLEAAATEAQEERARHRALTQKAEAGQAQAEAEAKQLRHRLHQQAKAMQELTAEREQLRTALQDAVRDAQTASALLRDAENSASALKQQQGKMIAALKTQLANSEDMAATLKTTNDLLTSELHQQRSAIDTLRKEIELALQAKTSAEKARSRRSMAYHAEHTLRVQMQEALKYSDNDAVSDAAHKDQAINALEAQLAQAKKHMEALHIKMTQEQATRVSVEDQLAQAQEEDRHRRQCRAKKIQGLLALQQGNRPLDQMDAYMQDHVDDVDLASTSFQADAEVTMTEARPATGTVSDAKAEAISTDESMAPLDVSSTSALPEDVTGIASPASRLAPGRPSFCGLHIRASTPTLESEPAVPMNAEVDASQDLKNETVDLDFGHLSSATYDLGAAETTYESVRPADADEQQQPHAGPAACDSHASAWTTNVSIAHNDDAEDTDMESYMEVADTTRPATSLYMTPRNDVSGAAHESQAQNSTGLNDTSAYLDGFLCDDTHEESLSQHQPALEASIAASEASAEASEDDADLDDEEYKDDVSVEVLDM